MLKKKNKKKDKKKLWLASFGKFILLGLNSAPLSLYLSNSDQSWKERKRGGGTSVGSRLTGELVPTLTFQGSLTLGQMGLLKFVVMSSHKSLAAYPPTKR